ncbi:hypothetical protein CLOM_g6424 [Closterium sp. NIES-68]|nr:hypothetical protein CLOM_g6424 [Closterium sp. NIES-68]
MAASLSASPFAVSPLRHSCSPPTGLPASSPLPTRLSRSARCLAAGQEPPEGERESSAGGAGSAGWGVRPKVVAQATIAVATAGFVDAGYSGDWSRIGAITPEAEHLLQLAALPLVPLAALTIFLLWDHRAM